jgi:hypothetical protein
LPLRKFEQAKKALAGYFVFMLQASASSAAPSSPKNWMLLKPSCVLRDEHQAARSLAAMSRKRFWLQCYA